MSVEILDVACGLEYLHSMEPPLSHCDLKGVSICACLCFWEVQVLYLQVNILITSSGRACIADFGIAKARDSFLQMTTTCSNAGTRHFMAPELLDGKTDLQKLDRRPCDMYALACVCYEVGKTISPCSLTYDKTCRCSLGRPRLRTRMLCVECCRESGQSGHLKSAKTTLCGVSCKPYGHINRQAGQQQDRYACRSPSR